MLALFLFGLLLIAHGLRSNWKRRYHRLAAEFEQFKSSANSTVMFGAGGSSSYRIDYKEGRKLKSIVVSADSESDAIKKATNSGMRFDRVESVTRV